MRLARAGGVPVPEVHDVDGRDMVLERVDGPTMLTALTSRPWQVASQVQTLVELHRLVHRVPAPGWLRPTLGTGQSLLHLDLHPANIILSSDGPVLLDWQGAAGGEAATDLALTYLLLRTSTVPGRAGQRVIGRLGQFAFAALFRAAAGASSVDSQLRAVARRRLADPTLLPQEASRIRRMLPR